jgi:DNA-binding response OmpR family regulator
MRVLVVEDARSLADVLVEGLRDQRMAVDAAHDGLEAAADPFTNTVAVTIGRLRRKLGEPPVITTAPGVGYRIIS